MKKFITCVIPILLIVGIFAVTPASSECILDMSSASATFGFDGTTNTLYISNIQFLGTSFIINWKLNLSNGDWDINGTGGAASGSGGLIDFGSASASFSDCVNMVISNFMFLQQAFSACWVLDMTNGNWGLSNLGDECEGGGGGTTGDQTSRVLVCVVDATNGDPLSGVTVNLNSSSATTSLSGSDACASFSSVPYGTATINVTGPSGYVDASRSVTIDEATERFEIALSPVQASGEYRVVLTWGENPRDLDSHLLVPAGDGSSSYHVYYARRGSQTGYPYAWLDVDDVTSYGPETITISQTYAGTYRYYIYLYCCETQGSLSASGANVTLFRGSTQLQTWNVPRGSGRYWHVFDLNAQAGTFTSVDVIQGSAPTP